MGAPAAAEETELPEARHRRRRLLAVAAVLVLAFAVRLGCAFTLRGDVRATFLSDMSVYDLLARQLAHGRGYVGYLGQPTAFFPPGYPALLGAAYRLFGDGLATARTMNALLGALTCLLAYAIAARLFAPAVGLAAAAILAVFPGDVFGATITMSEVMFGCLFAAILYLFVRWNDAIPAAPGSRWFLFGLALGGAALVRGVALPFLAVPFVVWMRADGLRTALTRTAVAASAVLLRGAVLDDPQLPRAGLPHPARHRRGLRALQRPQPARVRQPVGRDERAPPARVAVAREAPPARARGRGSPRRGPLRARLSGDAPPRGAGARPAARLSPVTPATITRSLAGGCSWPAVPTRTSSPPLVSRSSASRQACPRPGRRCSSCP